MRAAGLSLTGGALASLQERLRSKGLENSKLEADTSLVLAQAEQVLAAARKTSAEADSIDLQNLEKRIDVVKKLIDMSRELEPAHFVDVLSAFEAGPAERAAPSLRPGAKTKQLTAR